MDYMGFLMASTKGSLNSQASFQSQLPPPEMVAWSKRVKPAKSKKNVYVLSCRLTHRRCRWFPL